MRVIVEEVAYYDSQQGVLDTNIWRQSSHQIEGAESSGVRYMRGVPSTPPKPTSGLPAGLGIVVSSRTGSMADSRLETHFGIF